MVYLDKLEGSGPFCTNSRLGRSVPMHCTALGKSVLAFLPPPKARAVLIRHGMPRYTARTIVALSPMDRELARVRRQGYAIDDVEFEEGVRCMGAPISSWKGRGQPNDSRSAANAPIERGGAAAATDNTCVRLQQRGVRWHRRR